MGSAIRWSLAASWLSTVTALLELNSSRCVAGEYFCQDRCGSDAYGQTCCAIPDGLHNLCGTNTKCCKAGCCPSDTNCNDIGACERTITTTDQSGQPTTSIITVAPTDTLTYGPTVSGPAPLVTTTQGANIIAIISGSISLTLSAVTTTSILTTEGQTITLNPAPAPHGPGAPTAALPSIPTTVVSDGQAATTTIGSDGSTLVIIGTLTATAPADLTSVSVLSSEGQTFTFVPPNTNQPAASTTTGPAGNTVVITGTNFFTFSQGVTTPVVTTANGQTFTFDPTMAAPIPTTSGGTITTNSSGTTDTTATLVPITDTTATTNPVPTKDTATTTDDQLTTEQTIATTNTADTTSNTATTDTLTTNSAGTKNTAGTTISDGTVTSLPLPTAAHPTNTNTDGDLPVIATWSPFKLGAVPDETSETEPNDDGIILPCKVWFINICLLSGDIRIGGWKWPPLPPGIYPPGPPPGIEFPSGFSIQGDLPPWPKITIGRDKKPTFSPQPTSCQTKEASIVATTTSYDVSVSGTITSTTASRVLSTTARIAGCNVDDQVATATGTTTCATSTITDVWLSCTSSSGAPTTVTSCTTTSTSTQTGCDITATTRQCIKTSSGSIPLPTDNPGTPERPNACGELQAYIYVVYPRDGTNNNQCNSIDSKLKEYDTDLYRSKTEKMGTNFWTLSLSEASADEIRLSLEESVASIYTQKKDPESTIETMGPSTSVQYQAPVEGGPDISHLAYINEEKGKNRELYQSRYYFEASVTPGDGVPVYILDTGATLEHREFALIRDSVRWIHVGRDVDGRQDVQDDSATSPDPASTVAAIGHGTSMLSLVTGFNLGVSKRVKPIVVRVPRRMTRADDIQSRATYEDYMEGLGKIADDFLTNTGDVKAIVLMSLYFPREEFRRGSENTDQSLGFEIRMRQLLTYITSQGGLVVTGSGNEFSRTIDGWPANFGAIDNNPIPGLLVVGGLDTKVRVRRGRTDLIRGLPHVYAPYSGFDTADGNRGRWVPDGRADGTYRGCSGTSCSAAISVGLAAYLTRLRQDGLIRFDDGPEGLRRYMLSLAWSRSNAENLDLPGVFNGVVLPKRGDKACKWTEASAARLRFWRRQQDECEIPDGLAQDDRLKPTGSFVGRLTDLPTLTDSRTIIPTGSACASTATMTQCAMVGGRGSACISSTFCGSFTATGVVIETTTAITTSLTQVTVTAGNEVRASAPTAGPQNCFAQYEHGPVDDLNQGTNAISFCSGLGETTIKKGDTARQSRGEKEFTYSVEWAPDCTREVDEVKINSPMGEGGDLACNSIMRDLFMKSNPRGGVSVFPCNPEAENLRYTCYLGNLTADCASAEASVRLDDFTPVLRQEQLNASCSVNGLVAPTDSGAVVTVTSTPTATSGSTTYQEKGNSMIQALAAGLGTGLPLLFLLLILSWVLVREKAKTKRLNEELHKMAGNYMSLSTGSVFTQQQYRLEMEGTRMQELDGNVRSELADANKE
ncbi:Hypothetical protein D9617_22g066810 [Elsinoe fawcettii]|nr:Hypothetical protein D9617_22g066810 [Elsinoe fawcettii]